jgi:hypothetical protein
MELRIRRPEKYSGNPTPAVGWREFMELRSQVEQRQPKGSCVIMVGNAIRPHEVDTNESYRAVCDDLKEEIAKYADVKQLVVPRPGSTFDYSKGGGADRKGVGKAFAKFADAKTAKEAMQELAKRTFNGNDLSLDLYDEQKFDARDFSGAPLPQGE